jgi:DNA repair protein RadD
MAGMQVYREWLLFEHGGYPARKAGQWWRLHGGDLPVPTTVEDCAVRWSELTMPATITTRPSGKWFEIVGRTFESQQQEGEAA